MYIVTTDISIIIWNDIVTTITADSKIQDFGEGTSGVQNFESKLLQTIFTGIEKVIINTNTKDNTQ